MIKLNRDILLRGTDLDGNPFKNYTRKQKRRLEKYIEAAEHALDNMQCINHKKYKGIRKPKVCCYGCWHIYYRKNPDALLTNPITGQKITYREWIERAQNSAQNLIKNLNKDKISSGYLDPNMGI